jgi:hypothetical protein
MQSDPKQKGKSETVCRKTGRKSIKWKMAANNFGTQKCLGAINLIFFLSNSFQHSSHCVNNNEQASSFYRFSILFSRL